jgi:hypothetical protein
MRRVLDLNEHSTAMAGSVALLLVVLPAALWLAGQVAGLLGLAIPLLGTLAGWSLGLGLILLSAFTLLVIAEQIQDRRFDRFHGRHGRRRLSAPDGFWECPHCGYRRLSQNQRSCPVCGKEG